MSRPPDLPHFDAIGPRLRWWRKHRQMTQAQLSAKAGISQSTLAGLENEKQTSSTALNRLATILQIDPHYLETGEGDPEPGGPKTPQLRLVGELPPWWPFKNIGKTDLQRLSKVELHYAESKLLEALNDIVNSRRTRNDNGTSSTG